MMLVWQIATTLWMVFVTTWIVCVQFGIGSAFNQERDSS